MVVEQHRAVAAERRRHPLALALVDDQLRVVEPADSVGEEDAVVRERLEARRPSPRARSRTGGWPWTTAPTSGPHAVHARVQDGLEVQDGGGVVDRDHVLDLDLVERHALPLDPDLAVRPARADMAERQVGVALAGEDPARPGDLLADGSARPRPLLVSARAPSAGTRDAESRRPSRGRTSPVFATACQTPAGMCIASPSRNGTTPSSSRSSPGARDDVGGLLRLVLDRRRGRCRG